VYTRGERFNTGALEDHVARTERLLGHDFKGGAAFYVYERPEEINAITGQYANGVTRPSEIHSLPSSAAHEVVHIVALQVGDPGRFFQEGLAVALTAGGRYAGRRLGKLGREVRDRKLPTVSRLVSGFASADPAVSYPVAGAFVSHLIDTHGLPTLMKFFAACKGRFDERAFREAFGRSLQEAEQSWMVNS
jgi:hypothetical protein